MKQETANGTIIIPYWKSAPYWPLIYTNIAGVCTFEKFVESSQSVLLLILSALTFSSLGTHCGNNTILCNVHTFAILIESAPYWPLIYTNIAGVCTFEKFVVDSKIMSSKIIKRGRGRNGMFGKTQSDFSMIALVCIFELPTVEEQSSYFPVPNADQMHLYLSYLNTNIWS
jgi:hypothetical protein